MDGSIFKFLWKYLSKLKFLFFATIVFRVIAEACTQQGIYYSSRIVGIISENADKEQLLYKALYFAVLMSLFILARGVFHNSTAFMEARFLPMFNVKIAKALFNQAHKHSMQFFSEEMSGRVATKVRQTIREVADFYNNSFNVTGSLIRISITFYFIFRVNWILTVILLVFFIFYLWFLYHTAQGLMPYSEKSHDKNTIANGVLVDTMFNHSLIRNYCHIFFEKLNYFNKLKQWAKVEKAVYIKEANMFMTQGFLRAVLQMIFLLIPLYYWVKNEITIADFVLVESLTTYLTLYCMDIVGSASRSFRNLGGIKDGLDFLYRPLQVVDKPDAVSLNIRKAHIKFENVSFGYKNGFEKIGEESKPSIIPLLFQHFNLDINAGEKLGLAGHSGSGKSSLVKLLGRYYDIYEGKISINKHNIADLKQDSLRRNISIIHQDPSLFNRNIMENIRYGNPKASDNDVITAAKKAYVHDFIMTLPQGYESRVGERGITLSGGERQRIAIARAILKNAPILILDEATSALDSESEIYIQQALRDVMKNKTVIAIAHRLSTLREMDRLIVLDNGKIIEEGSHTELMRKKGAYYDFYQLQSESFRR